MQLCGAEPPCGRPALGLKDNQVVTLDEVEQKFRNLAKKLHPDQGGQDESHARSD
jgi:curved DNA-binding protein CbpA